MDLNAVGEVGRRGNAWKYPGQGRAFAVNRSNPGSLLTASLTGEGGGVTGISADSVGVHGTLTTCTGELDFDVVSGDGAGATTCGVTAVGAGARGRRGGATTHGGTAVGAGARGCVTAAIGDPSGYSAGTTFGGGGTVLNPRSLHTVGQTLFHAGPTCNFLPS